MTKTTSGRRGAPTRRTALSLLGLGGAAACAPTIDRANSERPDGGGVFAHGLASGDPTQTAVILWTRVTPNGPGPVIVHYDIDTDPAFSNPRSGRIDARAARDYCAKVDVTELMPGTVLPLPLSGSVAQTSETGRTKTLAAEGLAPVRFAVVSCCNLEHGFFNAYDLVARRAADDAFDAMLHLGDYYYEYGANDYDAPNKPAGREHEPPHEIITLADYRTRQPQYRRDPNLQAPQPPCR